MDGTSLLRFKRAYIAKLAQKIPQATYQSPSKADEVMGQDGSGISVTWLDTVNISYTQEVFVGPGSQWVDEQYDVTLVIQVLGLDSAANQDACDRQATLILGRALKILHDDPTVGIVTDQDITQLRAVAGSAKYVGGVLPADTRAAKIELAINVEARLTLENP